DEQLKQTVAPQRAIPSAMEKPMPWAPPVISATLPLRSNAERSMGLAPSFLLYPTMYTRQKFHKKPRTWCGPDTGRCDPGQPGAAVMQGAPWGQRCRPGPPRRGAQPLPQVGGGDVVHVVKLHVLAAHGPDKGVVGGAHAAVDAPGGADDRVLVVHHD